jgi:hypothetical protein
LDYATRCCTILCSSHILSSNRKTTKSPQKKRDNEDLSYDRKSRASQVPKISCVHDDEGQQIHMDRPVIQNVQVEKKAQIIKKLAEWEK